MVVVDMTRRSRAVCGGTEQWQMRVCGGAERQRRTVCGEAVVIRSGEEVSGLRRSDGRDGADGGEGLRWMAAQPHERQRGSGVFGA
jgi:hypothetical protein